MNEMKLFLSPIKYAGIIHPALITSNYAEPPESFTKFVPPWVIAFQMSYEMILKTYYYKLIRMPQPVSNLWARQNTT